MKLQALQKLVLWTRIFFVLCAEKNCSKHTYFRNFTSVKLHFSFFYSAVGKAEKIFKFLCKVQMVKSQYFNFLITLE